MSGAPPHSPSARSIHDQGGFTIVEAAIAGLILMIGSLASLGLLDASTRSAFRVERGQVAINRAQAELERIRSLPYDEVALSSAPTRSNDKDNPRNRVTAGCASQGARGPAASR